MKRSSLQEHTMPLDDVLVEAIHDTPDCLHEDVCFAFAEGLLSRRERSRVRRHLRGCVGCALRVATLHELRQRVREQHRKAWMSAWRYVRRPEALSAGERRGYEGHLTRCPSCAVQVQFIRALPGCSGAALPAEVKVGLALMSDSMTWYLRTLLGVPAAAAVAVAVVLAGMPVTRMFPVRNEAPLKGVSPTTPFSGDEHPAPVRQGIGLGDPPLARKAEISRLVSAIDKVNAENVAQAFQLAGLLLLQGAESPEPDRGELLLQARHYLEQAKPFVGSRAKSVPRAEGEGR